MKKANPFDLHLAGLSNRHHEFDYVLDDAFFAGFEQTLLEGGNLTAHLDLDKTDLLLTLTFTIRGTVELICDRSLEEFTYPVHFTETLHVRFGAEYQELADDVLQITPETAVLPLAQHLFDYVATALPMKRLHPRFSAEEEAEAESDSPTKLIFSTKSESDDNTGDGGPGEDDTDPRWAALRNLN